MNGAGLAVPVHWYFPMRCRAVTGSNTSSTCTEAPANVGAMTPKVRPRAWETGAGMHITSNRSIFKALTACIGTNELQFDLCRQPSRRDSRPDAETIRCGASAEG